MTKELRVIECLTIKDWYEKVRQNKKLEGLTVASLWALRKNMKPILETADSFNEFKTSLEEELKAEYFTDEKSEEGTIKDENGEDVNVRKVKEEFLPAYQEKISEVNEKLNELMGTMETFNLTPIDIEKEVQRLGDSCSLDIDDLDMLSVFEEEDDEEGQDN